MMFISQMRYYFLLIPVLLLLSKDNQAQSKKYMIYFYNTGEKLSEGWVIDDKPDGYWKTYHINGKLKSEGNRRNFELDSLWKFYNKEGIKTMETKYNVGKREGKKSLYNNNGTLVYKFNYESDERVGEQIEYFETGELKKVYWFKDRTKEGFELIYDTMKTDVIDSVITYEDGIKLKDRDINNSSPEGKKYGKWILFHSTGNKSKEGVYSDGKKDGYFKYYDRHGHLLKVERFENGEIYVNEEGESTLDIRKTYYTNAAVKTEGGYKYNEPEGIHLEFSEDGVLVGAKIYEFGVLLGKGIVNEEGKKQGTWEEYYESGKLRAKGKYLNDNKYKKWKFYYESSKLEQVGYFDKKGRYDREWKWYFENYKLLREETYSKGRENGLMIEYNRAGEEITRGNYENGLKQGSWDYHVGDHTETGKYLDGKKDGKWHYYFENGRVYFVGTFADGDEQGKHKYYYNNGNIKEEQEFLFGSKQGLWRKFDENGLLIFSITYVGDVETKVDGKKVDMESIKE